MTKVVYASEFLSGSAQTAAFARRNNSLARELAKRGMKVWLITHEEGASGVVTGGVPTVRIPPFFRSSSHSSALTRAIDSIAWGWALGKFVRRVEPDVVIASFHEPIHGLVSVLAGRLRSAHTIFDAQDSWLVLQHEHAGAMRNRLRRFLERQAFRFADIVTTVTPTLKEMIAKEYGIAPERVKVVYNGADLDRGTRPEARDIDIIHLGSPRMYYHTLESLGAFTTILRRGRPVHVVFLGSSSEEYVARVREETARLNLTDCVEFVPPVSFDTVGRWLGRAKVALHTLAPNSVYKCAIGLKVFEYLAHGLPVVHMGPKDGETAQLIQNWNCGFVAENPEELGEALLKVLDNETLRQELSNAALRTAVGFSWEQSAKSLSRAIDSSCGDQ